MKRLVRTLNQTVQFNYHKNVIDHYENPRNVGTLGTFSTR